MDKAALFFLYVCVVALLFGGTYGMLLLTVAFSPSVAEFCEMFPRLLPTMVYTQPMLVQTTAVKCFCCGTCHC